MPSRPHALVRVALALACAASACCPKPPSPLVFASPGELLPDGSLPGLGWLAGAWASIDGQTEEHWTLPRGGTMLGAGRSVIAGRTRFYEHLRIEQAGDAVLYHASPSGQAETTFRLVERSEGRLVFENPEHADPSRITYERTGDASLVAHVEGTRDGKPTSDRLELWRVEPPETVCP
ncbi:MAG: hypothetical protein IT373_12180 [Polyangiaceae bacterium]|nr:hypothetical protein [Polyangiaceae bacterium]